MTRPTESARVRRIRDYKDFIVSGTFNYVDEEKYDNDRDVPPDNDVLDFVIADDPKFRVAGYSFRNDRGSYLPVNPLVASAEVGLVSSGTLAMTFSEEIMATNYSTGTVITVNSGTVGISSATRQANAKTVYYVLATPVSNGKEVKWYYNPANGGQIVSQYDSTAVLNISGTAANNT